MFMSYFYSAILKNGNFGYYVEEWTKNKKIFNYSIKFLIDKIGKSEKIDDPQIVIEKITKELLIEYINNYKKNK